MNAATLWCSPFLLPEWSFSTCMPFAWLATARVASCQMGGRDTRQKDDRADIDDAQSKTLPRLNCDSSPHTQVDLAAKSSSDFPPRNTSSSQFVVFIR
jgi:hypothetical protein